ncbi:MAG: hypothetical protein ACLGIN_16200, partial [Candidatus Sericytochromatia bacterium]
ERSDDDFEVVLTDEAHARLAPTACVTFAHLEGASRLLYDAQLVSLSSLEAKQASNLDLDRWPYERAPVLYDRDGVVQSAVSAAGGMSPDFRAARLRHSMVDAWLAVHRAEKTLTRGFEAAGRQVIARGTKALARVLFALEHRWVPLDHWLEAELATLEDPAGAAPWLRRALVEVAPGALTEALERLQAVLGPEVFPASAPERRDQFLTLIHPACAVERRVHGLF